MNITFFIGNGFDLNYGLKTSYKSFYDYYCYLESSKNDMLAGAISKDYKNWSDLEMGLAKFVDSLSTRWVDEFIESKVRLEDGLVDYLKRQENRVLFNDEARVAEAFRKKILNFYECLNAEWREEYRAVRQKANAAIQYQFVTFNYTELLDKLVELCNKKYSPFSSHIVGPNTYQDTVHSPLHIHGTLSQDLILGIDAIEQLSDIELHSNEQLLRCFVKTQMNKELGERRTENLKKMIAQSRYILLYGLSWGDSDQTWWKELIEWLISAPENRLVLCAYVDGYVSGSAAKKLRIINEKKKYFACQGGCDNDTFEEIKDRIQVIINPNLFDIKEIQVKPDELDGELSEKQHKELAGVV